LEKLWIWTICCKKSQYQFKNSLWHIHFKLTVHSRRKQDEQVSRNGTAVMHYASLQRIGIGSEHSGQLAPVSTASQTPLAVVVICSTSLMNNVSVSNTTVTATRNPLTDFSFFTNTSISGGIFTINFISKDNA
jgi:hypothetical protein